MADFGFLHKTTVCSAAKSPVQHDLADCYTARMTPMTHPSHVLVIFSLHVHANDSLSVALYNVCITRCDVDSLFRSTCGFW